MSERSQKLFSRQDLMENMRSTWEPHWQEIADRIFPRQAEFTVKKRTPGSKRTDAIFDAVPALALDRFAAALESMLTPRTQRWHRLRASDHNLNQSKRVLEWFEEVTRILFEYRYSPKANFASQKHEGYMSLGAFGSEAMFITDLPGGGIRYNSRHLAEVYVMENQHGLVDLVHRKFEMTARQAVEQWGKDVLPDKIVEAAEKSPGDKFEFLHVVQPNEEQDVGRLDYRGMPYVSVYLSYEGQQEIDIGGFNTFPWIFSRYVHAPGEVYGRSPAMLVLPDIKVLNTMNETVLKAGHLAVAPPLAVSRDGIFTKVSMRPQALNWGAMDQNGKPLVAPIHTGGRVDIGLEMMDQKRKVINDAFLVTLFQILVETPTMTATEALMRAQEKGALLAPAMGRQQTEALGPMIERELDILNRSGKLPPMPPELIEAEGEYAIEYDSPMTQAQKAEESIGLLRTLEAMGPMISVSPDPAKLLRRINADEAIVVLARNNGVPERLLRSDEELAAMDEADAQAMQAQQLLQAAPVAAQTAKTLTEAQAASAAGAPGKV